LGYLLASLHDGGRMSRPSMLILIVLFVLFGGGCASIENLGTGTFGPLDRPCGLVYGGLRSDVYSWSNWPIGIPYWFIFDAIGDTITLPYILARQTFEWAMTSQQKPHSTTEPTKVDR
jgi:uncharacterized protein YceK